MKRTAIMTLTIASTLLLGGCYPHWEEGDRYDRDHDHRREYRRDHDRGYYYDGRGYDRDYYRRDDRRRHRDRDDNDNQGDD
ncbi:hypothetical protein [Pseudomonas frederiksbergensis]|uniref:hypothetical protein n=1 Tax=Pseudomonas frederiksbergensis TaxID=104087 RepID=UPI003B96C1D5